MEESRNCIPHIIHYCWFGNGEKPDNIKKFISSWHKILPDYTFVEWNEGNFDISTAPIYVQEAYSARKYAFVSDYVRIKALYDQGGVYLDTDIEIVKRFDDVLTGRELVVGFESNLLLETAFIACSPHNTLIGEFCKSYDDRRFVNQDGSFDMSVINYHFTELLKKRIGLDATDESYRLVSNDTIAIYPREYFAAFDVKNWHVKPTDNTYTIHHMNSSWSSGKKKVYFAVIHGLQKVLGYKGYDKLKGIWDRIKK